MCLYMCTKTCTWRSEDNFKKKKVVLSFSHTCPGIPGLNSGNWGWHHLLPPNHLPVPKDTVEHKQTMETASSSEFLPWHVFSLMIIPFSYHDLVSTSLVFLAVGDNSVWGKYPWSSQRWQVGQWVEDINCQVLCKVLRGKKRWKRRGISGNGDMVQF